ncbi:MAG TPA: DNA-3-methyladenine glycosylase 2 family protein [Meiothermus sp.]|jgi:DNA-3-methyladenine glycosylase II|nr:DNA-3-methyladenine glycosylase 2 family protein [Meiothermus sp.]
MILDERNLLEAVQILCELDADLARAVRLYGPPPWWAREPGFATLVWIILEQQVSLASAKATFSRLQATIPLTPQHFLTLDDATLKSIGFSRQKTAYVRHLSQEILNGFDLESLYRLDDHEAKARLVKLKGIGNWTADVYLLMALRRPDAWPVGDLGLQVGMQELKGLLVRPAGKVLEALAEPWRPWRSAAARIVWHSYLSRRSS